MKKRALFLLGLLCLCLYFSSSVLAQSAVPSSTAIKGTGKIGGVLVDSLTGKPIEYATVALLPQGSSEAIGTSLTNAQGQFSFSNLSYRSYALAISFIGYQIKSLSEVSVTESKPDIQLGSIKLTSTSKQLKEVQVNALRPTITQEADKMVVSIEGTALAAGRTAYDVLAKSPGVFVDPDGNIQLNGRSGVTVMLNGKLTYLSASDLRTMLEGMSAENIKNIEIITNPSAKFDAEGSSGILNINLKKNDLRGINGSVYASYNSNFKQQGYSTGGSLNHKSGNWNSFLTIDQLKRIANREGTFTREFYAEEKTTYFDQVANGKNKNQGPPTFRIGTDYSFNDQHSIGVMASLNRNTAWGDFLTDTYLGSAPNQPEEYIKANNYTTNTFTNYTTNLHYMGKLDTVGTTLSADLDFVKITNGGYSNFYNFYGSLVTNEPTTQDFLYSDTDNGLNIYAAKIDYATPLFKKSKLEIGAKASRVSSDNDSRFYFNNGEAPVLDPNRTNYFIYDENIYAAYANFNTKLGERYTLQAGLRAERTKSKGESLTTGEVTERKYLNLFPSVFLQQKITEDYQIAYSYSRRIQRPNYGNLNPFISYRDPYTYWTGNPYLRPQYTNSFGITQTFKKDYSLVLNYQYVKDVIAELPILDVENATTIYTVGNVDDLQNVSLAAIAPIKILKNWDTNNTITLAYNEYRLMVNNEQQVNDQMLYMLQTNHNILLPLDLRMEVSAVFRGPGVSGLYRIGSMYWVDFGLKKSFLDKKLELSLNVNDIFRSYRLKFDTTLGNNINNFDQYFYRRSIGLTVRYNFSRGQKFDPRRRNNSLDEVNRT